MNAQHRAQLVPGHNSYSPSDPAHANDSGSLFCISLPGAWIMPGFFREESKRQYIQEQASCGDPVTTKANVERHGLKSETREPSLSNKGKCVGTWATEQLQSPSRPSQSPSYRLGGLPARMRRQLCHYQKMSQKGWVRNSPQLFHHVPVIIYFLLPDHPVGLSSGCSSQDQLTEMLSTGLSASGHSNDSAPMRPEAPSSHDTDKLHGGAGS